jgi:hypothetical protein
MCTVPWEVSMFEVSVETGFGVRVSDPETVPRTA